MRPAWLPTRDKSIEKSRRIFYNVRRSSKEEDLST